MIRFIKRLIPKRVKYLLNEGISNIHVRRCGHITRELFSYAYIRGKGIEFGALNAPLPVANDVSVQYADRYSNEFMLGRHKGKLPELKPLTYITSLETCEGIADGSQDFIIANHVVEHLENPIMAIESMLRILKIGGILFMALPDRRYTFDFDRPLTTFQHVRDDYQNGSLRSRQGHYLEVAQTLYSLSGSDAVAFAEKLEKEGLDTHFHVWEQHTAMDMILRLKSELDFPFEILVNSTFPVETLFVLRKIDPTAKLEKPAYAESFSVLSNPN
jgi:SAM-dependent methyltransferase